jgi:8-oxo-dGTP pyrophosphatase MutT (NUDIX family)
MARDPIPTYCFALVVVRLGHRFLLVHERKHGQLWYLPAGRVEPGEGFAAAAVRETLEESGVPIVIEGVLRMEHGLLLDGSARLRVFFLARPRDDTPPKSITDPLRLLTTEGAPWD